MQSFGPIAPFYDELMKQVPYDMWAGYYLLLLAQIDSSPDTVLDVCCGTGTVSELMDEQGFQVTGFDLSAKMIAEAKLKAKAKKLDIDYFVGDARNFDLGKKFDGAFSFFDSLNYITDLEGLRAAIAQVAKHLIPGGSFIFDVNTAFAFEEKLFDQQHLDRRSPVRYKWRGEYDEDTRIIRVHMDFWKDGEHYVETHVQRAHRHEEIFEALEDAGFKIIQCYDSYTLNPPRARSDRVHYAAKLP
jgi:SAM-dependent methyltransferase